MGIITAIIVFGIIIAIHEFGHFAVAKLCDIKVNKFAIGMGPRLIHFQKGETEYSLRLFPIGGYCSMEGEDSESSDERAFGKKKVYQRFAVVIAGAIMNLILGVILSTVTTCMSDNVLTNVVGGFREGASSSESGLMEGDRIISIDGMYVFTDSDIAYKLGSTTSETFDLEVERNGEKITLNDVKFYYSYYYYADTEAGEYVKVESPESYEGEEEVRLAESKYDFWVQEKDKTLGSVVSYAALDSLSIGRLIWISFIDLISGKYGLSEMSGPVGIVSAIGTASKAGIKSVLSLSTFITINVGIFNLLPLPALDGGRLVFLIVEAIRKKPVPPEKEGMVHFIGLAVLMVFMVIVTLSDVRNIFMK